MNKMQLILSSVIPLMALSIIGTPSMLLAHNGEKHESVNVVDSETVDLKTAESLNAVVLNNIGGRFSLKDHNGQTATEKTFSNKHTLVFFGYTDCQVMCSISLDRIGRALTILQEENEELLDKLVPLVVTVDPENDTAEKLRTGLAEYHPSLLGLTGSKAELQVMYDAYNQKPKPMGQLMNEKEVVSHSSYFYLMGPGGKFNTLFPPILNPESMASILKKYLDS